MASVIGRPPVQVVDGEKPCSQCNEWKPVAEYTKDAQAKTGLHHCCKDCRRLTNYAAVKRWNERHPEARREAGRNYYHRHGWKKINEKRYGITPEQYEAMLNAQAGVCAICRESCSRGYRLAVDHDHLTGVVRGLLCSNCNAAIGLLREDPQVLTAAITYLTEGGSHHG